MKNVLFYVFVSYQFLKHGLTTLPTLRMRTAIYIIRAVAAMDICFSGSGAESRLLKTAKKKPTCVQISL